MNKLEQLKLVTSVRNTTISPVLLRRNKLIAKLDEQLQICIAKRDNTEYAPKRIKVYTDSVTGERKSVETNKRLREWYWTDNSGVINLSVKYGSVVLPLNKKGDNAIQCANRDELISTLKLLKEIVANGELDGAIVSANKLGK